MNKENNYKTLLIEAKVLIYKDVDDIANMANISRLIMEHFPNHWIGFYRVQADKLILGPFQGPIACTSINFGKGVCGAAWQTRIETWFELPVDLESLARRRRVLCNCQVGSNGDGSTGPL